MASKKTLGIQQELIKAQKAEIVQVSKETNLAQIEVIEDQILQESISIVKDCLNFAEIGFDDSGQAITPEEWEDLPLREKERKIRLAKAAWMPSSDVPHGVKMAQETMMGIIKSRADRESGTKILNIENASFPTPSPIREVLEVLEIDE